MSAPHTHLCNCSEFDELSSLRERLSAAEAATKRQNAMIGDVERKLRREIIAVSPHERGTFAFKLLSELRELVERYRKESQ